MSSDRVLVTGAAGFTGRHLIESLLSRPSPPRVVGTDRVQPADSLPCEFIEADITDGQQVEGLLSRFPPHQVYHLAAASAQSTAETLFKVNVLGTVLLLETLSQIAADPLPRLFIPGSAAEYGGVGEDENPIPESRPSDPATTYGFVKKIQSEIAEHYQRTRGLSIVRARVFNLIGPGQPATFFIGSLIRQVLRIRKGDSPPVLEVGNLSPRRDFVDVRDAVQAYQQLMEEGHAGEIYNVGSGRSHALKNVVERILLVADVDAEIRVCQDRVRDNDAPRIEADLDKIHRLCGWKAEIPLEETVRDMLRAAEDS